MERPSPKIQLPDIKPRTEAAALDRAAWLSRSERFPVQAVGPLVGMSTTFIKKVLGPRKSLATADVIALLDQDAYAETFVPRSKILEYLVKRHAVVATDDPEDGGDVAVDDDPVELLKFSESKHVLVKGHAIDTLKQIAPSSVQCVVTSTPYWGLRIYENPLLVEWADGEVCAFGHEQTPEGFIRHSVEMLWSLQPILTSTASVWWNIGDTYNTRTQIRGNAAEALRAMQGKDKRKWSEHYARRYSAGHSYLKDGEQSTIPTRIAERASRIGYHVKSVITWAKQSTTPEPQNSRVSRGCEYVLHLSMTRTPKFHKEAYRRVQPALGGRSIGYESDKLADVWVLPTSTGKDGHGAQFPAALPGRCIALSSDPGDVVLDPFVGSGNSGVAARMLGRRFIGIDVSDVYLASAEERIGGVTAGAFEAASAETSVADPQQTLPMVGSL